MRISSRGGFSVIDRKKRFAIIIVLVCLLACALIARYFNYTGLPPVPDSMTQLNALLEGKTGSSQTAPAEAAAPVEGQADKAATKPHTDAPKVEFENKLINQAAGNAATDILEIEDKYTLPPARLAPDMFTFSSLPNNAPVAEFPLVLVGQKNLEWYRTRSGNEGGGAAGLEGAPQASIYGHPPKTPPSTPPGPPGPPGPPEPPPEVSTSGL